MASERDTLSSTLDEILDTAVTAAPEYASTDDNQRAPFLGAYRLEADRDAIVATSELAAAAIERALVETGMPNGVFALLTDTTVAAGQELVTDDRIEAVAFTGSFTAGKAIYDIAARRQRPIPVYAEMGSTNPVFVLPGAAAQRGQQIARELADSITLGVGQFRTKPGIVVAIEGTVGNALIESIADRAAATMLTSHIADQYVHGVNAMLEAGASLAAGKPGPGQPVLARVGHIHRTPRAGSRGLRAGEPSRRGQDCTGAVGCRQLVPWPTHRNALRQRRRTRGEQRPRNRPVASRRPPRRQRRAHRGSP